MLETSFFPTRPDPGLARFAGQGASAGAPAQTASAAQPVFRMELDPEGRIDGSVPVWTTKATPTERIVSNMEEAARQPAQTNAITANAYVDPGQNSAAPHPFVFKDLVDMVNPLQHIPLVGNLYRYVTGDTIQPVSQVIGDAVYGGPLAAAAAMVNVIVHDATGKDIAGNIMALAFNDSKSVPPSAVAKAESDPIALASNDDLSNLPGGVIGFADLRGPQAATSAANIAAENAATVAPSLPQRPAGPLAAASFSAFEIY